VHCKDDPKWDNQRWVFECVKSSKTCDFDLQDGRVFTVTNVSSDLCMKVEKGSMEQGAHVIQSPKCDALSSRWRLVLCDPSQDRYQLVNYRSGHVLYANGQSDSAKLIQLDLDPERDVPVFCNRSGLLTNEMIRLSQVVQS
jgi:Ricin-type beta-trefoil lectin domain-like